MFYFQQWLWEQLIIQETWIKTKRKNPVAEAIVLLSKNINNLPDGLCEDYFCLYSEVNCQDDETKLKQAFILFSKVLSFSLPTLVRSRWSLYSHYKWERFAMTLWNLKILVKDDTSLRGNFFLFKVENTLWISWATYLKWMRTCLSLPSVWNMCKAIFDHQTDNIIKGKSILYAVKQHSLMEIGLVPEIGMNISNAL